MAVTTQTQTQTFSLLALIERITSNYVLRRIVKALFTVWVVATITFFVVRAMPGNAVDILIQELTAQGMSPDDALNQAASLLSIDLHQPLHEQYFDYLANIARGDFGTSYRSRGLKVADWIAQVLPWTLFSVGLSLLITFVLGVSLGAIIAYKRDTWIDHLISNIAAILDAVSPILIGLLAYLVLNTWTKLVPIAEMRGAITPGIQPEFSFEFFEDVLMHFRVLGLVYVLSSVGSWILIMKSNTIATLGEDRT